MTSTVLFTDHYELTMVAAALRDGTAQRRCVFEVFARRLPSGRRYGVVAGTDRLIEAIQNYRFEPAVLEFLLANKVVDDHTAQWLANYQFHGNVDGYPEGELYFPESPILTVEGEFAEAVVLETIALSILNYDCAVASAAARMVSAAEGRPMIEMGSRRAHEEAAVAAARSAYLAGFSATSNLAAGARYGIPTAGTAAHAFTMVHDNELDAFKAQVATLGFGTTLLVDTYDISEGIRLAVEAAGPELGAIRIDSGDLGVLAKQAREQLDKLGATNTKIVVSGDLDENSIASLAAVPADSYGVGTSVVTGSGAPTAEMVYKLVEVDGRPVIKRSTHKATMGGRKTAFRRHKESGTSVEEILISQGNFSPGADDRPLQIPFIHNGQKVAGLPDLAQSREHLRQAMITLPWEGLKLSWGEPAIPTRTIRGTS